TALLRAVMGASFATFPSNQFLNRQENHVTPSVNVQYGLTGGAIAYFSYSEGFKSGGFNFSADSSLPNGDPGPGTEFEDERVNAFEIGV
ncbi:TonB-dependent receptor domain-containing protein, partial [Bacillus cereus group sp. Bc253]|uniref:TonB-dependent receptor domain-containing protein n=1 Tax=Bacillus cereus group sp. Bc253 TaxID=3018103 RepID=UPI003F242426